MVLKIQSDCMSSADFSEITAIFHAPMFRLNQMNEYEIVLGCRMLNQSVANYKQTITQDSKKCLCNQ